MPVKCTFLLNNQRMSALQCPGLGAVAAFSGDGASIDNPAATAKKDEGPLPKGTYYIVDRQSGGHLGWLWDTVKDALVHSQRNGGCITLASPAQFLRLRAFLKAQPALKIPGTGVCQRSCRVASRALL